MYFRFIRHTHKILYVVSSHSVCRIFASPTRKCEKSEIKKTRYTPAFVIQLCYRIVSFRMRIIVYIPWRKSATIVKGTECV